MRARRSIGDITYSATPRLTIYEAKGLERALGPCVDTIGELYLYRGSAKHRNRR